MKVVAIVILSALITLFGLVRLAFGVQPLPDGARLSWDQLPSNFSNYNYSVWRTFPPGSTNWLFAGETTNQNFLFTNALLDGTMVGVTSLAQSNKIWSASDIGIAFWMPTIKTNSPTLRITPIGGVRVATNQWTLVSHDMLKFDQRLRFHNPSPGVILVEHQVSTIAPYLFMDYPVVVPPPLPGGAQ